METKKGITNGIKSLKVFYCHSNNCLVACGAPIVCHEKCYEWKAQKVKKITYEGFLL